MRIAATVGLAAALTVGSPPLAVQPSGMLPGSITVAHHSLRHPTSARPPAASRLNVWSSRHFVRQSTSFTCGPAALATLLHFYLRLPATERSLARLAKTYTNRATSIRDLEVACGKWGLAAHGCKPTLMELLTGVEQRNIPAIVLFQSPEPHYVLLVGRGRGRTLLISDPARGNRRISERTFGLRWSGVALVVRRPGDR